MGTPSACSDNNNVLVLETVHFDDDEVKEPLDGGSPVLSPVYFPDFSAPCLFSEGRVIMSQRLNVKSCVLG